MGCATVTGTSYATQLVEIGWNKWSSQAVKITADALNTARDIAELEFASGQLGDIAIDVADGPPRPFARPGEPSPEDVALDTGGEPVLQSLPSSPMAGLPSVPVFTAAEPVLNFPVVPGAFTGQAPADDVTLTPIVMPDAPDDALPTLPTLRDIGDLPDVPDLAVVTFDATAPSATGLIAPGATFTYEDAPFQDGLLDDIRAKLQEWLLGGTGLPPEVEAHLWERARSRERATAAAAEMEVERDWAGAGFSLPGGVLDAKRRVIREKLQDAERTISRDIAVKQAELEQQNLHFTLEKGVALTEVLANLHNQAMQRAFAAAQYAFQSAIELFNARVELYKAQLAGYQTEATVYKTRLEAELTRLEAYKAELEGKKIIGELNLQDVELYKAQLAGLTARVELHKSKVSAITAVIQADGVKAEVYKARVSAFGERIRAYAGEVEAYAKRVEAEGARANVYESLVRAFAAQTSAYGTTVEAMVKEKSLELQNNQLMVDAYKAKVAGWAAKISAEAERVKAVLGSFDTKARLYEVDGRVEGLRVTSDVERYRLALGEAQAKAELLLKSGQLNIEQIQRLNALELSAMSKAAEVFGQLAAASMAAVNLSAGISTGDSTSKSCSESYSY